MTRPSLVLGLNHPPAFEYCYLTISRVLHQVLGAWGLGWEVWMDGMEITQFTYFQQASSWIMHQPDLA
jgi:hypothetical protein